MSSNGYQQQDEEVKQVNSLHRLSSQEQGESDVERLAQKIMNRRAERIPVPFVIRRKFVDKCYAIAIKERYKNHDRIHLEDVIVMRDEVLSTATSRTPILKSLGFFDYKETWTKLFDRAELVIEASHLKEDGWFYYQDFAFHHTDIVSEWPWLRDGTRLAWITMFAYYFITVIFFCHIVNDDNICPADDTGKDRPYYGWMSALYFASTTMATVGYGDLTVEKESKGRIFVGIIFMIFSILMAIMFFGAVADTALSKVQGPIRSWFDKVFASFSYLIFGEPREDDQIYMRVRRVRFKIIVEIVVQFTLLNLIGVLVSRFFANNRADEEGEDWDWMTSLYWAVQTSTTIGYGDLRMTAEMRWFQIFYLTLSTYFAGNALGRVAAIKLEVAAESRIYAWSRREASKGLLHDFRTDDLRDSIDQYEFALASLLSLEIITSEDLAPIMDKFRALAGNNGYIDLARHTTVVEDGNIVGKLVERTKSRKSLVVHEGD